MRQVFIYSVTITGEYSVHDITDTDADNIHFLLLQWNNLLFLVNQSKTKNLGWRNMIQCRLLFIVKTTFPPVTTDLKDNLIVKLIEMDQNHSILQGTLIHDGHMFS